MSDDSQYAFHHVRQLMIGDKFEKKKKRKRELQWYGMQLRTIEHADYRASKVSKLHPAHADLPADV